MSLLSLLAAPRPPPTTTNSSCFSVNSSTPTMAFRILATCSLCFLTSPPCAFHLTHSILPHWLLFNSSYMLDTFPFQGFVLATHSAWNALSPYIHVGSHSRLLKALCTSHHLNEGCFDDPEVHSFKPCPSTPNPFFPHPLYHLFYRPYNHQHY